MKTLLVARGEELREVLSFHLGPLGFAVVQLEDPVRAIQALDELDPQLVLYHAGDFPRHWKPLLRLLRENRSKDEAIFVLLHPQDLPLEEAAKATHLGVNGLIGMRTGAREMVHKLEELFRRYRSMNDKRRFHRLVVAPEDRLQLAFTHPYSLTVLTGSLVEISIQGASFRPADPSLASDLRRGQELPYCSLRVGDQVIAVVCRVTRNRGGELGLELKTFETGGHQVLFQYLQSRSERALKGALARRGG